MHSQVSRNFTAIGRNDIREVSLSHNSQDNSVFPSNEISTGKYTLLTLLPKNLMEQFKRVANVWFLVVSVLQLLPQQLSPTSSWATIAPLALVLTLTLLKDAFMDIRRHLSDRRINSLVVSRWNPSACLFESIKWQHVSVGDLLLLSNEPVPADLILLATSDSEGICYIDTANLDGESNLKVKSAVSDTNKIFKSVETEEFRTEVGKLEEGVVHSEKPNNRLYNFEGYIRLKDHIRALPIDNSNLLLRGCRLLRTQWALGLVVFTGPETKIMMNSKSVPHKRSSVERRTNRYLGFVFGVLVLIAGVSTLISVFKTYNQPVVYAYFSGESSKLSGLNFFTYLILYNGLVPISLYVTMDIVRVIQSKFIQWDLRLYREETDHPAVVKTPELNEDLGQIEYIFSDKTGTLTENRMMFKACSVRGKVYQADEGKSWNRGCANLHSHFHFSDPGLISDLAHGSQDVHDFLEILALCHTVTPAESAGEVSYQGASPDEEALVLAAHCFGYSFLSGNGGIYTLQVDGNKQEFRLIGINEFSSTRKRMSIVLRPIIDPSRPSILLCKGADSVMLNLCYIENSGQVRTFNKQLYDFSMKGLRTLVLARKELSPAEGEEFERKWNNAKRAIADREKRLEEVAEEFEVDMDLIGITAIEDKVQDGVSETIAALRAAGIKVWVLTGDKQETALNIGFSCGLLTTSMTVVLLGGQDGDEVKSKLMYYIGRFVHTEGGEEQHLRRIHSNFSQPSNTPVSPFMNDSPARPFSILRSSQTVGEHSNLDLENLNISLVVSGECLNYIFSDKQCSKLFTILACISKAVICCRVSPVQKADIVRLVKGHLPNKPLTMAIGDGGNDVSMIQEAHVGVGMIGNEGMQAVNASDYAIGRFRFLLPLLFLHGRWNYQRLTKVILYSFYKNFLLILPMFYYAFLNAYSGTALYNSWLIMSYNVFFTSLPVVLMGAMDCDSTAEDILKTPSMYTSGMLHRYFNQWLFLRWLLYAGLHSLLLFVLIVLPGSYFRSSTGQPESLLATGTVAFYAVVQTANYVILALTKSWNGLFITSISASLLFFYVLIPFYDYIHFPDSNLNGALSGIFTTPSLICAFWLSPLVPCLLKLVSCYGRVLFQRGDKVSPGLSYFVTQSNALMHRAGKVIRLDRIVSFTGLHPIRSPDGHVDDYSRARTRQTFLDSHIEKMYKREQITSKSRFMRVMLWLFLSFLVLWTAVDMSTTTRSAGYTAIRLLAVASLFLLCIVSHTRLFSRYYGTIILGVVSGGMGLKVGSDWMLDNDGAMSTAIVPIITFVLFNVGTFQLAALNGLFFLAYMVKLIVSLSDRQGGRAFWVILTSYTSLLLGIILVTGYIGYVLERESRDAFVGRKRLDSEVKRGQDILSNLLPKFVKDRVIMGERDIADDQGLLTLLFCDICDFDEICEDKSQELVKFLDSYFSLLDTLVDKHGLTKIETVNKTYMACGGLVAHESTLPAALTAKAAPLRVCELAFDILHRLESVTRKGDVKLSVKIGVHTGQTYSGVVGLHKPQFSLIGDTVNYASRMCAFGQRDKVQISMETYKYVQTQDWDFTHSSAKIKEGTVETILLACKKSTRPRRSARTPVVGAFQQQPVRNTPIEERKSPMTDTRTNLDTSGALLQPQNEGKAVSVMPTNKTLDADLQSLHRSSALPWCVEDTDWQRKYREFYVIEHMKSAKGGLWMTIVIYVVENAVFVGAFADGAHGSIALVIFRLLGIVGMLLLALGFARCLRSSFLQLPITLLYSFFSLLSALTLPTISTDFIYIPVLEIMLNNVVYNHISGVPLKYVGVGGGCMVLPWLVLVFVGEGIGDAMETTFFLIFFVVLNAAASFSRDTQSRKTYILNQHQQKERDRTEDLLTKLMPKHVYTLLQGDLNASPYDTYPRTTILFADICGFTIWAKKKSPKDVVGMLSRLYSAFDGLTVKHKVYKVHTIGDCYVVLGLNDYLENQRDHCAEGQNVVNMAIDMIREIKTINQEMDNLDIGMRIGIHTGTIVGGFVGQIVVRYDIFGPAVTKANKMESGGMKNQINVSEKTRLLLSSGCPDRFHYIPNGKEMLYEAKSKQLQGYFLDPVNSADVF